MCDAVNMKGISKYFGSFCALKDINLNVKKGTIHALLGENGAGKSTLMNILYGLYSADSGEIYINGKKENIKNPSAAIKLGIGMVHQHFMLVDNLTVTQNIIIGEEITNKFGFLNNKKIEEEIVKLSEKYGLYIDPQAKIENISVGMQQRVEILKILYRGADILIFDEPTAVLTTQEILEFMDIMDRLTKANKTVIIITHKLQEIKGMSSKCTIIRRGEYIDTVNVLDVSEQDLASMMVGREVNLHIDKKEANPSEVIFSIEKLTVVDNKGIEKVKNLSLNIRKGEIFGIAGVDGNGQKELVEAITCLVKSKEGSIKINGNEIQSTNPHNVIKAGISTIHEDRHKRGIVLDFSVEFNGILGKQHEEPFSKNGMLNFDEINKHATKLIEDFDVRPRGCEKTPIRALSGGNQQKFIIAREINNNPDLLIAVQPTRGVDVGAIEFIHKILIQERDKGKAILLISFELDEIMDVSDTIGVIYEGRLIDTFKNDDTVDENMLGLLMAGGGK